MNATCETCKYLFYIYGAGYRCGQRHPYYGNKAGRSRVALKTPACEDYAQGKRVYPDIDPG